MPAKPATGAGKARRLTTWAMPMRPWASPAGRLNSTSNVCRLPAKSATGAGKASRFSIGQRLSKNWKKGNWPRWTPGRPWPSSRPLNPLTPQMPASSWKTSIGKPKVKEAGMNKNIRHEPGPERFKTVQLCSQTAIFLHNYAANRPMRATIPHKPLIPLVGARSRTILLVIGLIYPIMNFGFSVIPEIKITCLFST